MEANLYKELGVSKDADAKTIKSSYRKIARENHPDRNPDNKAAEEKFKKASFAFEVLSDSEKRKLYDQYGIDGLREGFQPGQYQQWAGNAGGFQGGATFEDIFGSVFGGSGGGSPFGNASDYGSFGGGFQGYQGRPQKGRDIEAQLSLDFMKAMMGGEMSMEMRGREIRVRIPSGAANGDKLRLKGKGNPAPNIPGSKAGDLILELKINDHPLLKREALNLYLDLPITMGEAVVGVKVDVPTPSGIFTVTIPSGVNSGSKLRLKGKGVKRGSKHGDFYVIVQIHAPDLQSEEILEAAKLLEQGYSEPIRQDLNIEY